jgi:hypothetical protein
MSSVKVSALSAKTSPSGSEELLINDGGTSKKITIANLTKGHDLPTVPSGITTDTNKEYNLKLTDVSGTETLTWIEETDTDTTYSTATTTTEGLVKIEDDTAQTIAANTVTATASRTYGVQLNSSDQAVVNVPWTDTDTGITDVVDDTTPQLGGNLDFQTHKATSFTSTGIDDNATSTAITIDSSENVGIGTATPAATPPASWTASDAASLEIKSSGVNGSTGVLMRRSDNVTGVDVWSDNAYGNIYIDNYYNSISGDIIFRTARTTEQMRIEGTGDVTVETGNLVIGTSGKGIDFSATADGSGTMTSEVLDDYEEGTWTPTIEFGGASVGVSYSTNVGTYTKVGNLVKASCYVQMSSKGTSGGAARIQGLPFSVGGSGNYTPAAVWLSNTSFADYPMFRVNSGETYFEIEEITNAGGRTVLTDANYANNSGFMLGVTYNV